ncbi:MAG: hypothetical protein N4A46_09280 [Schleiferiaceae bacterium]|jgi:hypothetical protein|nr:hypothetical protein [Schleiferiaceae bacterium]
MNFETIHINKVIGRALMMIFLCLFVAEIGIDGFQNKSYETVIEHSESTESKDIEDKEVENEFVEIRAHHEEARRALWNSNQYDMVIADLHPHYADIPTPPPEV